MFAISLFNNLSAMLIAAAQADRLFFTINKSASTPAAVKTAKSPHLETENLLIYQRGFFIIIRYALTHFIGFIPH